MIKRVHFRSFKSIEDVEFEPGLVNVLIGANGSGKSNLLEALGVLSAAVFGRVDDEALLRRGVRPGVPALYKCSFPKLTAYHIYFGAWSDSASYEVSLFNPIKDPSPAWRYKTENLKKNNVSLVSRSPKVARKLNPEAGYVASKMAEITDQDALQLLNELRDFAIYTPNTPTLRGIVADNLQRQPIGLAGGQLATAILEMIRQRVFLNFRNNIKKKITDDQLKTWTFLRKVHDDVLGLIDWAKTYGTASASAMPLSPSVGSTERVIRFTDRYMKPGRGELSAYDASEGALYVLFHAALAAHPKSPLICAVDNADHGLNPRLSRALFQKICDWYLNSPHKRQIFMTTQNPLSLDGLPLLNDQVRLFSVSRTEAGRTTVRRIRLDEKLKRMAEKDWTLSRLWVMGHLGGVSDV
jgi:hypothetical protein